MHQIARCILLPPQPKNVPIFLFLCYTTAVMKSFTDGIVKYRYYLLAVFAVLVVAMALLIPKVKTNYDLTTYLPKNAPSTEALQIMNDNFGGLNTAEIMVEGVGSLDEANNILNIINATPGISMGVFSDDNFDASSKSALFTVFLTEDGHTAASAQTLDNIRTELEGYTIDITGSSVTYSYMSSNVSKDMLIILIVAVCVIILILLLGSTSWVDPLIFLLVLGGAIIINLGTNYFMGQISFVTNSICIVMQLALAMDYSVMLLHRYNEEKKRFPNSHKTAMSLALRRVFSPISSSGLTTIAGLLALVFMQYTIGLDIGLVLAKGVVISLICIFLFMPCVILMFDKLIEKTKHRSLQSMVLAHFKNNRIKKERQNKRLLNQNLPPKRIFSLADFQHKTRFIIPIFVVLIIAAGVFFEQTSLDYTYTLQTATNPNASINVEERSIETTFGMQNPLVVMFKNDYNYQKQAELYDYLTSYEVNGQKLLNSGQAFSQITVDLSDYVPNIPSGTVVPLTMSATAQQIADMLGLQVTLVDAVFSALDTPPDQSIYLVDFIAYASNSQIVKSFSVLGQEGADSLYQQLNGYFISYNAAEFAASYNLDPAAAEYVFDYMGWDINDQVPLPQIAAAIAENNLLADYSPTLTQQQQQFNTLSTLIDTLTTDLTPQQAAAFLQPFLQIDLSTITAIFDALGVTTINPYNLISYIYENQSILAQGGILQAQIDGANAQISFARNMFESGNFCRMIFNINSDTASEDSFALVENLRTDLPAFYGTDTYLVGESATYYDIRDTFSYDSVLINIISFVAILIIILLAFRSVSIPVLLTLLIQGAIWVSMGINAVAGAPIFFICYLMVMCIQMAATIDYAILLTSRYAEARKHYNPKKSISIAFNSSIITILTSGSIIIISSLIVGRISSVSIISSLGNLLAMGCFISLILVIFALPQILLLCDKLINKTTIKAKFVYEKKKAPPPDPLPKEGE